LRKPHVRLTAAIPALPVRSVDRSVGFYSQTLGFTLGHSEAGFAILKREDVELHLWEAADESWRTRDVDSAGAQGAHAGKPVKSGAESFIAGTASCRVAVIGIDDLHHELAPRGIVHPNAPLTAQPWGSREFGILDPDGNLITFFERQ
jgi:catechol 2,3-dioxygenase-like lactoylglutathione lyase family enzyme